MENQIRTKSRAWLRSALLFGRILVIGGGIVAPGRWERGRRGADGGAGAGGNGGSCSRDYRG